MRRIGVVLTVMTLIAPGALAATGADVLRSAMVPRAIALGGAFTAAADDVNALVYNPAGLARIAGTELGFTHALTPLDTLEHLALAQSLKAGGVIGGSLVYRHLPVIDNDGALDAPIAANDLVLTLGYGTRLTGLFAGGEEFAAGLDLKWLRSALGDYSASTVAADLGLQWLPGPLPGSSLGLAARNLGSALKYREVADDLPWSVRLGASYRVVDLAGHKLTANLEGGGEQAGETWSAGAGIEYWFQDALALRVGYQHQPDSLASVVRGGLGFKFSLDTVQLQADYAFKPVMYSAGSLDPEHFLSLLVSF